MAKEEIVCTLSEEFKFLSGLAYPIDKLVESEQLKREREASEHLAEYVATRLLEQNKVKELIERLWDAGYWVRYSKNRIEVASPLDTIPVWEKMEREILAYNMPPEKIVEHLNKLNGY